MVAEKIGQALREEYENGSSINELAAKVSKSLGDDVKVVSFVRFSFGE